jgi:transposase, IS30 family
MSKKYKHLSLEERQDIWHYVRLGYSKKRIARKIGRPVSTVRRELKRNANDKDHWVSKANCAHALAKLRRTEANESRTKLKSIEIQEYVKEKITISKWTPQMISLRIGIDKPGASISHEAIYQWLQEEEPELLKYLPILGKVRRRRRGKKKPYQPKQPAAPKTSIDERPESENNREDYGSWEGDLMVSKQSKEVILHLRERKSRYSKLLILSNGKAETLRDAVINTLGFFPKSLKVSLTFDNGSENAFHLEIAHSVGIAVYFCHAYHSWEKGTVENGNGKVRRFLPKGTDFSSVTNEQLQEIEDLINGYPMECLNGMTPSEVMKLQLQAHWN